MDSETALLVLELHLQDIIDLQEARNGKQRLGEIPDIEYALALQAREFNATTTSIKDRRMCQSISRAIQDDTATLTFEIAREAQAERDRASALVLSGHDGLRSRRGSTTSITSTAVRVEILERFSALNVFAETDTCSLIGDDNIGEGSCHLPKRKCVSCYDFVDHHGSYLATCTHVYCKSCITELFTEALKDESLFPPRCCRQEIPLSAVRAILGPDLTQQVELKAIEYATPDKTYCHVATCSTFIFPSDINGDRGRCTACNSETCTRCKQGAHDGDCAAVREAEVLELVTAEGWRRCFSCHMIVELSTGCNHITCRCRAEFCYVCGLRWKTCRCEQWDEGRLLERAGRIVDRAPQGRAVGAAGVAQIRQAAEHLRLRHECAHQGHWRKVQGRNQCEECQFMLPEFILECRECNLRACVRCRRNRL